MTIGMNVYVRNTTYNGWKKQILTIKKKKDFIYFILYINSAVLSPIAVTS